MQPSNESGQVCKQTGRGGPWGWEWGSFSCHSHVSDSRCSTRHELCRGSRLSLLTLVTSYVRFFTRESGNVHRNARKAALTIEEFFQILGDAFKQAYLPRAPAAGELTYIVAVGNSSKSELGDC